jgi:hypothetical protein
VKSTSGNDGTYLYFLEGSLTNAIGAMYAKEGVFIVIMKIALKSPFILYFFYHRTLSNAVMGNEKTSHQRFRESKKKTRKVTSHELDNCMSLSCRRSTFRGLLS